jgi:hypothetical protein
MESTEFSLCYASGIGKEVGTTMRAVHGRSNEEVEADAAACCVQLLRKANMQHT